jgi:hypothetical protein
MTPDGTPITDRFDAGREAASKYGRLEYESLRLGIRFGAGRKCTDNDRLATLERSTFLV